MTILPIVLCLFAPQTSGVHPRHHPSDAQLYCEAPDIPALRTAYRSTAIARTLEEDVVRATIEEFWGPLPQDPLLHAWDQLRDANLLALELPALDAELFADLRAVSFSAAPGLPSATGQPLAPVPTGTARLVLEFESEQVAAAHLARLVPVPDQTSSILHHGRHLTFHLGDPPPSTVPDPDAKTLVDSPELALGAGYLGTEGTTVVDGFSRLQGLDLPAADGAIDVLEGLFGPAIAMATRGGRWRLRLVDGRFHTDGFHPTPDPSAGSPTGQAVSARAIEFVDPEAAVGWITRLHPGALLHAIRAGEALLGTDATDNLEEQYGFRFDRDWIEALDHDVAFSLPPPASLTAAPDLRLVVAIRDREALTRGLEGLSRLIEDKAPDLVHVRRTSYRDRPIVTFTYAGGGTAIEGFPIDPAGLFRPTLSLLDDRLLVTLSPRYAKREIRRLASPTDAASEQNPLIELPEGVTRAGFADWPRFIARAYSSARALAPLLEGLGGELPFDPASLPEPDDFVKHFAVARHWTRPVDGGVHFHAESSIGPELALALLPLATYAIEESTNPSPSPPQATNPDGDQD